MNFFHWLTLLLIGLKFLGYFPYSWWIVFTPFLVTLGWGILLGGLAAILERKL